MQYINTGATIKEGVLARDGAWQYRTRHTQELLDVGWPFQFYVFTLIQTTFMDKSSRHRPAPQGGYQ